MKNYIKIFKDENDIIAAFSKKSAGDLKNNLENHKKFFSQFDIDMDKVVLMNQVHKANVEYADGSVNLIEKTDGIFTDKKELFLAVNTADCIPVFIYSSNPEFVGIVHCGWKSLVSGILFEFFNKASEKFELNLSNIKVYIGPHIKSCCFEIKEDVLDKFIKFDNFILKRDNKLFVDLAGIAKENLTQIGLADNIKMSKDCTFCLNNEYFSYRKEKAELEGEMLGFIGLKYE